MADDAFPLPGVSTITTITDWEDFFQPSVGSGVVPGVLNEMAPTLDTGGRNAVLDTGQAIVRAFLKPISASTATAIPAADTQDRIDRLVLRLDRSAATGPAFVVPTIITGTPGPSPAIPALVRAGNLWDLPMARWTSAATGALTGLVDERIFLANTVRAGTAAETPPQSDPGLFIETDTGSLLMSITPGVWDTVIYAPPDPWHTFSGRGYQNSWSDAAGRVPGKYRLETAAGNVAILVGSLLVPAGFAVGQTIVNLPAAYRPLNPQSIVGRNTSVIGAGVLFEVSAAGNLIFRGSIATSTSVGDVLDFSGRIYLDA